MANPGYGGWLNEQKQRISEKKYLEQGAETGPVLMKGWRVPACPCSGGKGTGSHLLGPCSPSRPSVHSPLDRESSPVSAPP